MSRRELTATVFDSLEFARQGRRLEGVIPLRAMARTMELLAGPEGEVAVALRGVRETGGAGGGTGTLWLEMSVSGELALTCQRCLGPLKHPLRVECRLRLVGEGESWPGENPADEDDAGAVEDAVPGAAEQSVLELVEDEVLLALPMAPKHEQCGVPDEAGRDGTAASPFAVLAGLKRKH